MEISLGYPKALIISVKSDGKSKQHRNLLKLSKKHARIYSNKPVEENINKLSIWTFELKETIE